jgi:hypothetical protein
MSFLFLHHKFKIWIGIYLDSFFYIKYHKNLYIFFHLRNEQSFQKKKKSFFINCNESIENWLELFVFGFTWNSKCDIQVT